MLSFYISWDFFSFLPFFDSFDDLLDFEDLLDELDFDFSFFFSFLAVRSLCLPFWSKFEFGLLSRSDSYISQFLLEFLIDSLIDSVRSRPSTSGLSIMSRCFSSLFYTFGLTSFGFSSSSGSFLYRSDWWTYLFWLLLLNGESCYVRIRSF